MQNGQGTLKTIVPYLVGLLVLLSLSVLGLTNYLLFHGIVEVAVITVCAAVFIIIWNSRKNLSDAFFLIIGISIIFIAVIDLVHTLAFKGMGVFPGTGANTATQLWIAARYFQSMAFLAATWYIGRFITRDGKQDVAIVTLVCAAVTALILAGIFVWQVFPTCYIEGSGLTPFKVASEYVIAGILLLTLFRFYQKRDSFDPAVWKDLVVAQALLLFGELAFTSYVSVYGFMNLLGHLFRLVSVYFFYRAVVVVALTRPADLFFRSLKQSEEALRESEERFHSLFDHMNEGHLLCAVITDEKGEPSEYRVLEVNAAFEKHLGISRSAAVGKTGREIFGGETPLYLAEFTQVARTLTPRSFETFHAPSGKFFTVSVYAPSPGRFAAVFDDITEKKTAERERAESAEYHRAVIINSPLGIMTYKAAGACISTNPAASAILGTREDLLLAHNFHLLTTWKEAGLYNVVMEALAKKEGAHINTTLMTPAGRPVTLSITVQPFQSGGEQHFILLLEDVTSQRQAQEALVTANKKLNILSSVTRHDILNRLTALKAYLELAISRGIDPEQIKFLKQGLEAARAIGTQITFTRYYQNIGVVAPGWFDVSETFCKAKGQLPGRGITYTPPKPGYWVFADPLVEKVFFNLMENSMRYGGSITEIALGVQLEGKNLLLIYTDNGKGIPLEDKERIFERGFGKNTGLGLFLSREILSITGITIAETGELNKGARFVITVPETAFKISE